MKVLMLSIDKKLFNENSDVRRRMFEYGKLFEELHIVVYTPRDHKKYHKDEIAPNVFVYPTNSLLKLFYFFNAYRLCKTILEHNTAIVVTIQDAITSVVIFFLRRRFAFPLQVQIHTDFLSPYFKDSAKNLIRYYIYKYYIIKRASCIRVVSKRIKDSLIKILKVPEGKIKVLPIYIDIETLYQTFKKEPKKDSGVIKDQNFQLLMVSRLYKEKNVSLALQAMKRIISSYPMIKISLKIFGLGVDAIDSIKRQVNPESILSYVFRKRYILRGHIFPEGYRDNYSMPEYYKRANAFLLTSNYEGYGLVLIEAAVSGLPIVTTNVGVVGEILKDGESALVCEPKDVKCIVEKIMKLYNNPESGKKLGLNAQKSVLSLKITKDEYLKLYRETFECCRDYDFSQ